MTLREEIRLTGIVLLAADVGDYDRRLVILTKERGKITAFARGAKRSRSALRAACNPFVCGTFILAEGRDAYTLYDAEVREYYDRIGGDIENACYASYFAEFANYYGRENLDSGEMVDLIAAALRALLAGKMPKPLIRRVYELRLMGINGEYTSEPPEKCGESAVYAWQFTLSTPVPKLFSFLLTETTMKEFSGAVDRLIRHFVDRSFKSLDVLKMMDGEA
jgi:DNA repair protein RecO (recombination protein O)